MAARIRIRTPLRKLTVPLASGAAGYTNDQVGSIPGTHTCNVMGAVTTMLPLGAATEDFSYANGDRVVQVALNTPADLEYFKNDPGSPVVLATDFLKKCYFKDAQTVTMASDNGSGLNYAVAGSVYDVHSLDGVGIKPIASEVSSLLS